MRIGELAKKHHVDIRTINFYTKIGLLPAQQKNETNNYRNYTEESEKVLWKIQVLRDIGIPLESSENTIGIREILKDPSYFDLAKLDSLISQLKKNRDEEIARYDQLIEKAEEMRKTGLSVLKVFDITDFLSDTLHVNLDAEQVYTSLKTSNKLRESLSKEEFEEIADASYAALNRLSRVKEKGFDSDEAQQVIDRYLERMTKYRGVVMSAFFLILADPSYTKEIIEDDLVAEFTQKTFRIYGEWFLSRKESKAILDYEAFKETYKEQFKELGTLYGEISDETDVSISDVIFEPVKDFESITLSESFKEIFSEIQISSKDLPKIGYLEKEFGQGFTQFLWDALMFYLREQD